ncbi:protein argonaute 12 [Setaria italica]|uniref:protein argonaute 12 n=1 Tax=Setaria italica TaxID=4555 RepID=UPI000BE4FFD0|nr:protein argonaute 12 [Setaria italica]
MYTRGGGGGGRRGGRVDQGDGRGGGGGAGAGRGRGRGAAADLGAHPTDGARGGGGGRGDRGVAAAPGAAQRGAHFQPPHPAAGARRGGYPGVAQGRGQQVASPAPTPTPVEVEVLRRQVERKVVVSQAPGGPREGPSSSPAQRQAPAPGLAPAAAARPQMQANAPGRLAQPAAAGSPSPLPARAPAPAPGQVAVPAPAGSSSSFPARAPAAPGHSAAAAPRLEMQGKAPVQTTQMALAAPAGSLPPTSSKALVLPPLWSVSSILITQVAITPESASRARNRWIINELVNLHKEHLDGRLPVYDGRKALFTAGPLPFRAKEFVLMLTNPERAGQGEKEYKVVIKDAAKIDMYSLQQFLAGRQREMPQEIIQALDIALRECPATRYTSISRSFFSSQEFGPGGLLGNGVECWRGYYQSLRPTQMGLSLNIDVSATAFYKAQPVIDFTVEYLNINASKRLSDQERIKLKKALKGVRVETTHRRGISIRYKITGLTSAPLNDLTFDQDGIRVSVVQYFRQQYNYSLKYTHWPCLQAGNASRPTYLPMEVCNIAKGQRYTSKLNEHQVRNILRLACERPAQREERTLGVLKKNNYTADDYAGEFGIKVNQQLALVDARVLPAPKLKYHDSGKEKVCNPSVGQWNMINKRMVDGGSIKHWACLTFASRINPNEIGRFCGDLVMMCNSIGMQVNTQPCVQIKKARQDDVEAAIRDIHGHSSQVLAQKGLTGQHLELLIIILPDMSGSYGMIKKLCETELGVITQCCAPKNVMKGGKQFLENLALKINAKVGGRNTVLEDALNRRIPLLTDVPTIVFGADVTHPPPGEGLAPSIAAVVASMDWPQVTKYKCLVSSQGHRVEIINDLFTEVRDPVKGIVRGGMIRDLLVSFKKSTGHKPCRIIFYRDGVSEGQFSQVLLYEMDAIRKACASLEEGYLPKVTFVVVQKRHHTRLFPENHRDRDQTDRSGNILPGTVVDTTICHPSEFDFYLCSHSGIQGTSRPAHYHVLFDENGFSADALQTLTYNLCYTYARCTRSVSIVPPAYYAHLGAFRARHYIEDDISEQGSSTGTSRTYDQSVPVKQLPRIKEKVQQFMFYC